ncbi:MAG TPA: dTDP-4-amino-4,6-dideoxygalactose transaminase [Solirubrobacteraceae bacterium]|nr:dTDP-4-amino-4,6-dideoxygalactose transaminase [Solirubrobacteraceae bacterium]
MIPFNRPYVTGREFHYVSEAIEAGHLSADGDFTRRCNGWLERMTGCAASHLTHSCTGALEMAVILSAIEPGDEVIMPSYTFVSTANAVVLRGGVPVFVEIRSDTLNIDETAIEQAVTPRTKAILVVHYAGVGCEMEAIMDLAAGHDLAVIEDAAQGLGATYRERPLGALGHLGAVSFHETKNVTSGEGGALLVNEERHLERAQVIHDKGTDRARFSRGEVDKYTWRDIGSSFSMSEISAAFLWAQLESAAEITAARVRLWERYHEAFAELELGDSVRRPTVPAHCRHNAHMYYLLVSRPELRGPLLEELERRGVNSVFHYVPLHSSPAGRRFGRADSDLGVTETVSSSIIRLPLWVGMGEQTVERVAAHVYEALGDLERGRAAGSGRPQTTSA